MRSSNSLYHGYLFSLSSVPVGSVVKRMALGKVYLTQLPHFLLNIIAPVLHASPTIYHARHKIVQCTTSLIVSNIGAENQGGKISLNTALTLAMGLFLSLAHKTIPMWRTT